MRGTIDALFVYPVKSCAAIALRRATVEARGLRHDRRWMIVDAEGRFVTQRAEPRLALVGVSLDEDRLVLSAPGRPSLELSADPGPSAPRRRVRVWRDDVDAVDCGDRAAAWTSAWLGASTRLVYMPDDVERRVRPEYARPGDVVGFADAFPLLVASASSLDDLNGRLERAVPMDRFRPNVVVRGLPAWDEDGWARVRAGCVPLRVAKPCARCAVTTVDQRTAERGDEPLRTLATFRTRGGEVHFAQNCAPEGRDALGVLAVGDAFEVVERREA